MIDLAIMNKTHISNFTKNTKWYLINAQGKTLGRLSTEIADILRGKNSPDYNPSSNSNEHVILINTKDIDVTGRKRSQKLYYRHSGRPGGLKTETFDELQRRLPNRIVEQAVKKMLPKGPLGRQLFKNLKVYADGNHPHAAQKPITIDI
uniref:ribosomal protein L13 n=1 Tax=Rhodochorton tenue TaxID=173034 RepID=UPI002A81B963|nr:ribosomal protein L13 [Rhodochorton tenue]WOK79446.1 ribosomal protein L13 [Rhodochorton tenue]